MLKRNKRVAVNFDADTFNKLEAIAEHERTTITTLCFNILFDNVDALYNKIMARDCIKYDFDTGYDVITIKEGDN